jgi:hypothetical protein
MSIRDISSQEAIEAADRFVEKVKDGTFRKRTLPNTGSQFNEEKALKSFKGNALNDTMKELAARIYE